jgi:hypothetical protein
MALKTSISVVAGRFRLIVYDKPIELALIRCVEESWSGSIFSAFLDSCLFAGAAALKFASFVSSANVPTTDGMYGSSSDAPKRARSFVNADLIVTQFSYKLPI